MGKVYAESFDKRINWELFCNSDANRKEAICPFVFRMGNQPFRFIVMIALLLQLLGSHAARTTLSFKDFGAEKDAWPELTGKDSKEAFNAVKASGIKNIYIQKPFDLKDAPTMHGGNVEDVWIYVDGEGNVVGIPQKGDWHENRINPGWTDLKGVNYEDAIRQILKDETGVWAQYGPKGFAHTDDYNLGRVIVEVDADGKVANIPRLG